MMSIHTMHICRGRSSKVQANSVQSNQQWEYGYLAPGNNLYVVRDDGACVEVVIERGTIGLCTGKKDKNGSYIFQGDVIKNREGLKFEVRYGAYEMYYAVKEYMVENVGFYLVPADGYESMPLGQTEVYAVIVGNIHDNPELKVGEESGD